MGKIIHWKSKITNAEGHGKVPLDDKVAEETVKSLNEEYPQLSHWLEDAYKKTPKKTVMCPDCENEITVPDNWLKYDIGCKKCGAEVKV